VQEFLQVDVLRDQRETDDGWLLCPECQRDQFYQMPSCIAR